MFRHGCWWYRWRQDGSLTGKGGYVGIMMPCGSSSLLAQKTVKASAYNAGDPGLIPESGRSPREVNGNPTPVLLPGTSHGRRRLVGYSPWGCKESDTTEWLHSESGTYFLGTARFSPKFQLYGPHDISQRPNSALLTQQQLFTLKKKTKTVLTTFQ